MVVLKPAGDVAQQQGDLVVISTILMLLIIVPVMAVTALFAWRYRAANKAAHYEPDWDHSTQLELLIWSAPLVIIICLGALTWVSTHLLDPYRPIARTAPGRLVQPTTRPLEVQVVALDWKWLFIYPEYGIATVNELATPVDRPIRFSISASSVMNSFYIPALAGQIYAMPGMETKLHAVLNHPGTYEGFSANFSGAGFSHMRFKLKGLSDAEFTDWVNAARSSAGNLDRAAYLKLEKPSEKEPVQRFAKVDAGLFDAVVNMCVEPGKMCMKDIMTIDQQGGAHEGSEHHGEMSMTQWRDARQLAYDKATARGVSPHAAEKMVAAMCVPKAGKSQQSPLMRATNPAPLLGAGLPRPGEKSPSLAIAAAEDLPQRPRS
ncbi:ubiquinol oxidase subunit II [Sphingobium arseniciresistens]|uniref:ubiquinol oxidase subunit II n=1 Tax=Sphingobium arseniciresistens TaxID=3030834 RepID=UPI003BAE9990